MNVKLKKFVIRMMVAVCLFGVGAPAAQAAWTPWAFFTTSGMNGEFRTWNGIDRNHVEVFGITGRARAEARNNNGDIVITIAPRVGTRAVASVLRTGTNNVARASLVR